jgi:hypothetical protein
MQTFTNNPDLALTLAHQTISERIHQAQQRTLVRTVRADRRAARESAGAGAVAPSSNRRIGWRWANPLHLAH